MWIFLLSIVVLAVLVRIVSNLVTRKQKVEQAYENIEVMLNKRYALIADLVELIKRYPVYERELLEEITALRNKAVSQHLSAEKKLKLNEKIQNKLQQVMTAVEDRPQLKADSSFWHLKQSWKRIENQLAAARRAYNAAVTGYNNILDMLPGRIIANFIGCRKRKVFTVSSDNKQLMSVYNPFNERVN